MKPAYLHVIWFKIPLEMTSLIQGLLYILSLNLILCIKLLIPKKKKKEQKRKRLSWILITLDTGFPKSLSLALGSTAYVLVLQRFSLHPALSVILTSYKLRLGIFLPIHFWCCESWYPGVLPGRLETKCWFQNLHQFFLTWKIDFQCRIQVIWKTNICLPWMNQWLTGWCSSCPC